MTEKLFASALEEVLGYSFLKPELLLQAMTHKSYVNENRHKSGVVGNVGDNERLEFLGDAVVNLIISHLLMEKFPDASEGDLSRVRARLVNVNQLARLAKKLGINQWLRLGKGEDASGGREKPSILADAYEALCAAVYLDGGYEQVFNMIKSHFKDILERIDLSIINQDYKTRLQELVQAKKKRAPKYRLVNSFGPDHDKTFQVQVIIDQKPVAQGVGKSKKQAEQDAARKALEILANLAKMNNNGKD